MIELGKPCIRGVHITADDVREYPASGMSESEVLADFPYFTREDIKACRAFIADRNTIVFSTDGRKAMILDYIDNLGLPDDDEEIFRNELRSLLEVYQRRWDAAVPQPAAEMVGRHPVQQVVPGVAMTQCVSADAFPGTTVPISSARFTAA